jgi:hypothetical protein
MSWYITDCHHVQFLGIRFCFGNLVDSDLLDLIHVEVGNLEKSVSLLAQDSKDEKVYMHENVLSVLTQLW